MGFAKYHFLKFRNIFGKVLLLFPQEAVTLLKMTYLEYRVYRTLTIISILQETNNVYV